MVTTKSDIEQINLLETRLRELISKYKGVKEENFNLKAELLLQDNDTKRARKILKENELKQQKISTAIKKIESLIKKLSQL